MTKETFGTDKQQTKENTETREENGNRQKKQIINKNKCQADKQQIKTDRNTQGRQGTATGNHTTSKELISANKSKRKTINRQ